MDAGTDTLVTQEQTLGMQEQTLGMQEQSTELHLDPHSLPGVAMQPLTQLRVLPYFLQDLCVSWPTFF